MKTADKIAIAYRAAKMVGREHAALLEIEDDGEMLTIVKNDPTGDYTSEWTIWVHRSASRQVARVYVPATGYEAAITAGDADSVILLDSNPEKVVEQTRFINRAEARRRRYL